MKIGTEKRCSFCGLYGISFLPLFWNTLGGMAHAQLLRLVNAYLLSLVHTEQLARTEIFSGNKLRHFIQKQNIREGQNCIKKILCLEAADLLILPFFFF